MVHEDIIAFFCTCIQTYIETHNLPKVIILAHSFGGFLATHFVSRSPQFVDRLILCNSAGIFPLLGSFGAYWAIFFKLSLPQSLFRFINRSNLFRSNLFRSYYFLLLSSPNNFSDRFVRKFIHIGWFGSNWTHPTIKQILATQVPLGFIYGELDTIMPYHQALAVASVCDACVPVYLVSKTAHSPYYEKPYSFANAFLHCVPRCCKIGPAAAKLDDEELLSFKSSYNIYLTARKINALYDLIQKNIIPKHIVFRVLDGQIVN